MLMNIVIFMLSYCQPYVDHIGCLKNREKDASRRYMENWLCGKECEQVDQIHLPFFFYN